MRRPLRFNGNEWSGSCGDIGTDLPLLVAAIAVGGMSAVWVCLAFGLAQIASGFIHRIPMPVQPLKALAALVIAGSLSMRELQVTSALLAVIMLALALTPCLGWLCSRLPDAVVRGIQAALGIKLLLVAGFHLLPPASWLGVAGGCGTVGLLLGARWLRSRGSRGSAWSWWWAPLLLVLGFGVSWYFGQVETSAVSVRVDIQTFEWWAVIAAIAAQLPLSIGNAVVATHHLAVNWYGDAAPSPRKIAVSYAASNGAIAALGAFPVCHGSGGLAGHHANGARTGGSVIIYGCLWIVLAGVVAEVGSGFLSAFPSWMLGGFLMLEAGVLMSRVFAKLTWASACAAVVTMVLALFAPAGFAWALFGGWIAATLFEHLAQMRSRRISLAHSNAL